MATPKLKIIVRLNEPHSPCGDVHRRRIPEALREPQACVPALTHPNHAVPEIAHQRPHDGPGMRFRDFSPPATTTRSTPRPNFSVPHPVMIGLLAASGCLASYGTTLRELVAIVAALTDKILKGAHPGDMPAQQPTKFEFIVNMGVARAIGLTIPPTILARVDEVIE